MLIKDQLSSQDYMTTIDKSIADFFLSNGSILKNISSRTIASQLYVAPSTITRFCQTLGFSGYNDFKEAYLDELNYLSKNFHETDPNFPFTQNDGTSTLISKLSALYKETIIDSVDLIDLDVLKNAANMIDKASVIYFGIAGDAYDVAETFKNRAIKIGKSVIIERRQDNLFYTACHAPENACFVLISYSGETSTLLKIARKLKSRKIDTIVITSFGENSLSKLFSTVLHVSTREKLVENLGNFSSLISISFLLDALYSLIFQKDFVKNYKIKSKISHDFEEKRRSFNPLLDDTTL